ncbi:hypothetical protein [Luethyella okanaganae]|uniref:Uncharacterized protein n=1 Tax=Luethyella okanaganae TaxID=69372 RepID=A0ABW1VDR9_9MICO
MGSAENDLGEAVDHMGSNSRTGIVRDGPWGFIFLLAYVGAAIYFISVSNGSFWGVVLGLLQAIVWPVYVVYHVLMMIGA